MSSKTNAKISKKDRPRSSDRSRTKGKRDGTPENPTTPKNMSGDLTTKESFDKRNTLITEEILAMQIKQDDLNQLRQVSNKKPSGDHRHAKSVVVKKLKPESERRPPQKTILVAKPAPPEATVKQIDYSGLAGPRFTPEGKIIPHSILGSVDEFTLTAVEHGDIPKPKHITSATESNKLDVKYEKKRKVEWKPFQIEENENALSNWQKRMLERRKQQDYLSRYLNKQPDQLVMNQADSYRKTQEIRYAVDRTIPAVDYGKGYRVGSEFWKQRENIGDEMKGLHMTLTQTEKGMPPPVLHVGVPRYIQHEKGVLWERSRTPLHKPWHRSAYLEERMGQLAPIWREVAPHAPIMEHLEVVGSPRPAPRHPGMANGEPETRIDRLAEEDMEGYKLAGVVEEDTPDPLAAEPDVRRDPVIGPCVRFAGQPAVWTGDASTNDGQTAIEARVTFETYAGQRGTSYLEIISEGTTVVHYNWKKIPKTNPFDQINAKVQRFYFNTSGGVILPGETVRFPFVFKSPQAGVFREQWVFQTRPVLCGGAALLVTLRGVALQEDHFQVQRAMLEQELEHRQAEQVVTEILHELVGGIQTPQRPSSPVDAYVTKEEIFERKNVGLSYIDKTVDRLRTLHGTTAEALAPPAEDEQAPATPTQWDLSVASLQADILSQPEPPEDDVTDSRETALQTLNDAVRALSFPRLLSREEHLRAVAMAALAEAVDRVVMESQTLRAVVGLPEKDLGDLGEEGAQDKRSGSQREKKISRDESRKGGKDDGKKGKGKEEKKVKTPTSGNRRSTVEGGRITPASADQRAGLDSGTAMADPILAAKYNDKLYVSTYNILAQALDEISAGFSQLGEVRPPQL